MAILEQLKLAEEFIRTILPGDMNYRLFKSEADQMIKIWKGFGKAYKKNKPIKYNPSLSPEAKRYLERYKLRTEGFILKFEHTEDEQTKAFVKLVKDTNFFVVVNKF